MLSGWKGLFAVEKDANAFQTLSHNLLSPSKSIRFDWPGWLPKRRFDLQGLISKFKTQLAGLSGQVDMLVGGPPCQGFSSAGRRAANDPRNALVRDYLKFVEVIRPRVVLIENVCGITVDFADAASPDGKLNYSRWIQDELSADFS
jgi:DNA (cytosine-5)-methyltransferase 1